MSNMETYTCGFDYEHGSKDICKCQLRNLSERKVRVVRESARDLTGEERIANEVRMAECRAWLEVRGVIRKIPV